MPALNQNIPGLLSSPSPCDKYSCSYRWTYRVVLQYCLSQWHTSVQLIAVLLQSIFKPTYMLITSEDCPTSEGAFQTLPRSLLASLLQLLTFDPGKMNRLTVDNMKYCSNVYWKHEATQILVPLKYCSLRTAEPIRERCSWRWCERKTVSHSVVLFYLKVSNVRAYHPEHRCYPSLGQEIRQSFSRGQVE